MRDVLLTMSLRVATRGATISLTAQSSRIKRKKIIVPQHWSSYWIPITIIHLIIPMVRLDL